MKYLFAILVVALAIGYNFSSEKEDTAAKTKISKVKSSSKKKYKKVKKVIVRKYKPYRKISKVKARYKSRSQVVELIPALNGRLDKDKSYLDARDEVPQVYLKSNMKLSKFKIRQDKNKMVLSRLRQAIK